MTGNVYLGDAAPSPERVPTLTEVIDAFGVDEERVLAEAPAWRFVELSAADVLATVSLPSSLETSTLDDRDAFAQLLNAALARVDDGGDERLRVALQPLIDRFTNGLIAAVRSDLRTELASSLRDLIADRNASSTKPPSETQGGGTPFV